MTLPARILGLLGLIASAGLAFALPETPPATNRPALDGKWHGVTHLPSPRLPDISICDKLNPFWWFGNVDEPRAPDWFKPGKRGRNWKWHLRNPFHNLTHYVIGIADKKFVRSGRYPGEISNPHGGWNFAVLKYKWLRLPFVSYRRGKFEFYAGWRVRGNFGFKVNFNPKYHGRPPAPAAADADTSTPPAENGGTNLPSRN